MTSKKEIIDLSKLILFLPIGLISGFIGGYLLSFIPNLLLLIPYMIFPGTEVIRQPIQVIVSNVGAVAIAINISLLIKPKFINLDKFLLVWGFVIGLTILIYIPLLTNFSGFESIKENKIIYFIELISYLGCYIYFFRKYKKIN